MDFLFLQVLTGIARGMNIFLLTGGFAIIYGVLRCVNLSHPSLYLISGYAAYAITRLIAGSAGFWVALLVAPVVAAGLGAIIERLIFRQVYEKHHYMQLLLGWGVMLVLADVMKLVWGVDTVSIPPPSFLTGAVPVPGGVFPNILVFTIVIGAAVAVGLYLLMYRTRLGTLVRALSYDQEATSALGINVHRLWSFVFAFCSWLAGVGGVVAALFTPIRLGADSELVLICFIVVVVGGLGSTIGALVGSLIFGVTFALGILVLPRFALVFMYAIMVLMLIFRPYGLFGKKVG